MADARFIYIKGIPDEAIEGACLDLSSAGVECEFRKTDSPGPWMLPEWFIPTAIVLYIAKPYLESFLGEMGKDHYGFIKKAVGRLWGRFFGANTKVPETSVVSEGTIRKSEYTRKFSIIATSKDGREVKLMLPEEIGEEDFALSTGAFLDFLCRHYRGDDDAVIPKQFNVKGIDGHVFVSLSADRRRIHFLDPLPKDVRDRLKHNE